MAHTNFGSNMINYALKAFGVSDDQLPLAAAAAREAVLTELAAQARLIKRVKWDDATGKFTDEFRCFELAIPVQDWYIQFEGPGAGSLLYKDPEWLAKRQAEQAAQNSRSTTGGETTKRQAK